MQAKEILKEANKNAKNKAPMGGGEKGKGMRGEVDGRREEEGKEGGKKSKKGAGGGRLGREVGDLCRVLSGPSGPKKRWVGGGRAKEGGKGGERRRKEAGKQGRQGGKTWGRKGEEEERNGGKKRTGRRRKRGTGVWCLLSVNFL